MINTETANFIAKHLTDDLFSELGIETKASAELFFSHRFEQFSKPNLITMKQKDSFVIISKNKSYLLCDLKMPNLKKLTTYNPTVKTDGRHLIARYLIEEYDMKEQIVIVVQSKADKSDSFVLSQGSYISIAGAENMRINVRKCKNIAIKLKESKVSSSDFSAACRLKSLIETGESHEQIESHTKLLNKLIKKHQLIGAFIENDQLPIGNSDEMTMVSWYLREGK